MPAVSFEKEKITVVAHVLQNINTTDFRSYKVFFQVFVARYINLHAKLNMIMKRKMNCFHNLIITERRLSSSIVFLLIITRQNQSLFF